MGWGYRVLKVKITNFKSVDAAELDLAPLTLLLGPPASGKSNILDAIALIGYFNRLMVLDKEYDNNASNLEPLTLITRFNVHEQLFRHHDLMKRIGIEVTNDVEQLKLGIYFEGGKLNVSLNDVNIPWDLRALPSNPMQEVRNALNQATKSRLVEARLYGYDRYGLASSTCTSPTICGFHMHLRNMSIRAVPKHIMSEFGWNAPLLIKSASDVIIHLNNTIVENLGEKVEVKVLRSGITTIFDYDVEVETLTVSDSVFRVLYYLMALRTAANYIKFHGLERRFILLLEEPEAHLFPFFLNLLVRYIVEAMKAAYIVITTHNPMLVSLLWDQVKDVKTYYTFRDSVGSTKIVEINVEKLAEEMVTIEEILFMPPREVLKRYAIESAKTPKTNMV